MEASGAASEQITPRVLVIMGVSGVGKTTIAEALVDQLHWPFQEGDDLHPPENRKKMQSGQALTDEDRKPWLEKVSKWIDDRVSAGEPGIITCSALKQSYRDVIVDKKPRVRVLYLKADKNVLQERIGKRKGHFMPSTLLDSQLQTLEEPGKDENAITVMVHGTLEETVKAVSVRLQKD